jgi:hypothetical protein
MKMITRLATRLLGSTAEDWLLDVFMFAAIMLIVMGSRSCFMHAG